MCLRRVLFGFSSVERRLLGFFAGHRPTSAPVLVARVRWLVDILRHNWLHTKQSKASLRLGALSHREMEEASAGGLGLVGVKDKDALSEEE
jgi:hypothetical protein